MVYWKELVFSVLTGKADLESPAHGIVIANLSVSFDAQSLVFEISLDAEHPFVWELAQEYESSDLWLKRLEISMPNNAGVLRADSFCLPLRRGMSEWPEVLGIRQADYADFEKPEAVRRLLLSPSKKLLEFQIDGDLLTGNHACYTGWEMMFLKPASLKLSPDEDEIEFDTSEADRSLISFSSAADFWSVEDRIHTGLSLAQGRNLAPFFKVKRGQCLFYGKREFQKRQALAMLREERLSCKFLGQLLEGALRVEEQKFQQARLAIRFFLFGKASNEPVEIRFLQLMVCVEAMDEVSQLREETTAALLGISPAAAKLLNCMRNKLIHGSGGYQEAFFNVKKNDFQGLIPELGPGFDGVVVKQDELQFVQFWLRLCERLDAFWCTYLGVDVDSQKLRYSPLPLMRNVQIDALNGLLAELSSPEIELKAEKQIEELRSKIQQLEKDKRELSENLRVQGELIRTLKAQVVKPYSATDTNSVQHEFRVDCKA